MTGTEREPTDAPACCSRNHSLPSSPPRRPPLVAPFAAARRGLRRACGCSSSGLRRRRLNRARSSRPTLPGAARAYPRRHRRCSPRWRSRCRCSRGTRPCSARLARLRRARRRGRPGAALPGLHVLSSTSRTRLSPIVFVLAGGPPCCRSNWRCSLPVVQHIPEWLKHRLPVVHPDVQHLQPLPARRRRGVVRRALAPRPRSRNRRAEVGARCDRRVFPPSTSC